MKALVKWVVSNPGAVVRLILVAALALLIWSWNGRGEKIADQARTIEGYRTVVKDMRQWHEETTAALERKHGNDQDRSDFEREAAVQNEAGRQAGDGPLAPVLRNGIDRLRERQAAYRSGDPR